MAAPSAFPAFSSKPPLPISYLHIYKFHLRRCSSCISILVPIAYHNFGTTHTSILMATVDGNQKAAEAGEVERFKYSKRAVLKSIVGREDKGLGLAGQRVVAGGWVKSRMELPEHEAASTAPERTDGSCFEIIGRHVPFLWPMARILIGKLGGTSSAKSEEGNRLFTTYLRINDGSCSLNLQVVMDSSMSLPVQAITIGTSILVEGVLQKASATKGLALELKVDKILHVGVADPKNYPLAKPKFSLEFLRAYPHLRSRSVTVGSITRIGSSMTHASHEFFQKNGFIHVHMPIITCTNTGSHGKTFQVTNLAAESGPSEHSAPPNDREAIDVETVNAAIKEKSRRIAELKRTGSNKEALLAAEQDLRRAKELALLLEKQRTPPQLNGFFSRPLHLSVSAGLHLESYACALSSVYTLAPVFQPCEASTKNLSERWMVEAELAFAELEDAMNCTEDLLKFICHTLLQNSGDDLKYVSKQKSNQCAERLQSMASSPFARVTYSEALDILNQAKDRPLQEKIEWGQALSEEHESYLADEVFKRPTTIHEYPKELKPFYVRVQDDGRTASAFDIIAPKVGVLVRGSQKEERADVISKRIKELGLPSEQYDWYLDLRKYGSVKHAGFSLCLQKMIMMAADLEDIKDAIPFPRTRGHVYM